MSLIFLKFRNVTTVNQICLAQCCHIQHLIGGQQPRQKTGSKSQVRHAVIIGGPTARKARKVEQFGVQQM